MSGRKTVRVFVGTGSLEHDFFIGRIQDSCIIGLDLIERWDAVVDVAARTLNTRFGTLELYEPEPPPFSFFDLNAGLL